jgi:hypothetical protein
MWVPLHDREFPASGISSKAKTGTVNNYEELVPEFVANDWTYLPMPDDRKYYNVKEGGEPKELEDNQFIEPDLHLFDVMEQLLNHPFLLFELGSGHEIIHLSNLNKREIKDFLYPLFSELAEELAKRIQDYYEDSDEMIGMVNEFTLGTWYKARQNDVELHIAEYLTLSNMIGIIKGHRPLMTSCGFESIDDVNELGGIEDLRNRVMHGNRTLVYNREMLKSHRMRIQRAETIVKQLS